MRAINVVQNGVEPAQITFDSILPLNNLVTDAFILPGSYLRNAFRSNPKLTQCKN